MSTELDWRSPGHSIRGRARPCGRCGRPALLVDEQERPMHKVCAEAWIDELDDDAPATTGEPTIRRGAA